MRDRAALDACGCFPTGRHYPGIAHLLRAVARGLVEGLDADAAWTGLPIALVDVETTGRDASVDRVVAREVVDAFGGCVPAAYNAAFDRAFLFNEIARAGISGDALPAALRRDVEWLDPLVWARELHHEERSRALGEVAARLGIALENAHRASDDAEAALEVLLAFGRDPRIPETYGALLREQRRLAMDQADERRLARVAWRGGP